MKNKNKKNSGEGFPIKQHIKNVASQPSLINFNSKKKLGWVKYLLIILYKDYLNLNYSFFWYIKLYIIKLNIE